MTDLQLTIPADLRYLGDITAPYTTNPYRQAYSPTGPTASTGAYSRDSNSSDDDWTDLVELFKTFNTTQTPDATFLSRLYENVNVEEWLKYFAANALVGNMETSLPNGLGDDYALYRGELDTRFQILSHDFDAVLGQGDSGVSYTRSIFIAADGLGTSSSPGVPAISRFLKNPAIAPLYYKTLKDMIDTVFSPAQTQSALGSSARRLGVGRYHPEHERLCRSSHQRCRRRAVANSHGA